MRIPLRTIGSPAVEAKRSTSAQVTADDMASKALERREVVLANAVEPEDVADREAGAQVALAPAEHRRVHRQDERAEAVVARAGR